MDRRRWSASERVRLIAGPPELARDRDPGPPGCRHVVANGADRAPPALPTLKPRATGGRKVSPTRHAVGVSGAPAALCVLKHAPARSHSRPEPGAPIDVPRVPLPLVGVGEQDRPSPPVDEVAHLALEGPADVVEGSLVSPHGDHPRQSKDGLGLLGTDALCRPEGWGLPQERSHRLALLEDGETVGRRGPRGAISVVLDEEWAYKFDRHRAQVIVHKGRCQPHRSLSRARFSNRVYSPRQKSFTSPMSPCRFLRTRISAMPFISVCSL